MNTDLMYYRHPNKFASNARVIDSGEDERGVWVELDQTIFHVQGGGQPADKGRIGIQPVTGVRKVGEQVRHYLKREFMWIGAAVDLHVDPKFRELCTRLHTAGHVLAHSASAAIKGLSIDRTDHRPELSYVEGAWDGERPMRIEDIVQSSVNDAIIANHQINTFVENQVRHVRVGEFPPAPCGGTHLNCSGDLRAVTVGKISLKKGRLKIRYTIQ